MMINTKYGHNHSWRCILKNYQTILFFLLVLVVCFSGCAEIEVPGTKSVLAEPLGEPTVKIGMTKNKVLDLYGDPDMKRQVTSAEWENSREEWLYRGRYPSLPVGAGYLTNDLYLYFDGDNVTTISKVALGKEIVISAQKESSSYIK